MIVLTILVGALCLGLGVWIGVATAGKRSYDMVREFHKAFNHPVNTIPRIVGPIRSNLRIALIEEELNELKDAVEDNDIIAIADALADLDYVVNGAAIEYGIDLPTVTAEVHRSNMTKLGLDGKPIYRDDGKIMKGENYTPPDIKKVLMPWE